MNVEQGIPPTEEEQKQVNVTAEVTCILNGVLIGAAAVLILNNEHVDTEDKHLESATVKYIKSYVASLVVQGITKDSLGFLWSQMGVAAEYNRDNTVQNVAHYLLGLVLEHTVEGESPVEESSTVEKQS